MGQLENPEENYGKTMGKWEIHRKKTGWESGKFIEKKGKPWERGKFIEKQPWENEGLPSGND